MCLPIDRLAPKSMVGQQDTFSNSNRLCLSVSETAETLGVSRSHAYELIRDGSIPSLRLGRRILIPLDLLLSALSQLQSPPSSN